MADILWSMTNYLKFHLGDDLELGSARQYGSYWDIPGGDVKVWTVNYKKSLFTAVHITCEGLQVNNIQCLTLILVSIIQQIPGGYSSLVNILVSQITGASG